MPYSRSGIKEIRTGLISTEKLRSSQQKTANNFNKTKKKLLQKRGTGFIQTRGKLGLPQQKTLPQRQSESYINEITDFYIRKR